MNNTYLDQLLTSAEAAITGASGGALDASDDNDRWLLVICERQQAVIGALVSKVDLLEEKLKMTNHGVELINRQLRSMT